MTNHLYSLYGQTIDSFLPFPELSPGDGPPDVVISEGKVPDQLPEVVKSGVLYQAAPGRMRFAVDGIAKYLVSDGRSIVVEQAPAADEDAVRLLILGSAMAAILHQRGWLPLHASAIVVGGQCVAFVGHSGKGKSTLAAALHARGHPVLADDVLAVRMDDGGAPEAFPAYAEVRLWADALEKLGIDADGLRRARSQIDKASWPTGERQSAGPVPVTRIYVLTTTNKDVFELEPVEGQRKLAAVTRHTYRRLFLDGLGGKPQHFRLCVALCRHARVLRVVRPTGGFEIDKLATLIEKDLATLTTAPDCV